jgi:MFS family permease
LSFGTIIFMLALSIILGFIFGYVGYHYAPPRGRDPYAWAALGFFFGVVAVLALFILPKINQEKQTPPPVQPIMPAILSQDWFYLNEQHEQQPLVKFEKLKQLVLEGVIKPKTYLWTAGFAGWKRLKNIDEISEFLL